MIVVSELEFGRAPARPVNIHNRIIVLSDWKEMYVVCTLIDMH